MEVEWLRQIQADLVGSDDIIEVVALSGGEVNETLRVRCVSGASLVVRRAPESVPDWHPTIAGQVAAIELALSVHVPAPKVVYASQRVLAYEYIEGKALSPATVSAGAARETGRTHGRLHTVKGDGLGPVQADGSSPGWGAEVAFAAVETWVTRLLGMQTSLNRSDLEAAGVLLDSYEAKPPSCLLHGDASPGNTIGREGQIVSLIDFDDAWYGDPAGDAAWWWWNSPETADAFLAGCAETTEAIEPPTVWAYRLRLLLGLADTFASTDTVRARRINDFLGIALSEATIVLG